MQLETFIHENFEHPVTLDKAQQIPNFDLNLKKSSSGYMSAERLESAR